MGHGTVAGVREHVFRGQQRGSSSAIRVVLIWLLLAQCPFAAFINFDNCLSQNEIDAQDPKPLQFVPLFASASFNTSSGSHNLNLTVYGNVAGIATIEPYPDLKNQTWRDDPNDTVGKIPDLAGPPGDEKYTTFGTMLKVLGYIAYDPPETRLCNTSALTPCPFIPAEPGANLSDISQLSAMTIAHSLYSSYAFTTITAQMDLRSGNEQASLLACIQASITPDLGNQLSDTLTYVPLAVLIMVALATAAAAILSPWGSMDVFRFTSNYGRDDDLLRLVTPGFGDCLQYIQFIVLAGSLSLNYPGYYQPVVSQVSWSALMFNESFVSKGNGSQSLIDGVYAVNGTRGMDRMSQLVGMTKDEDIWAGMIVWLLVIIAAVIFLIQVGFAAQWIYRLVSNTQEEDLRRKNIPLCVGNVIRIVFNYFLLPIVALSTYQLVVADLSPNYVVALAAILIVALALFAGFLLWLVATTRPRSYLFDDLPTVLLYGPLYNTYSDNAATFALVPVTLTFVRGITIGALQPSGIAQLVLLAICEVVNILTLNAFRPFHSPTSMNLFHTLFAVIRLITILLSVAFLPTLGVNDASRGWIGYVILLLHAIVLVFGFFLNAIQTLIEVLARLAGAGGEEGSGGGATRGGLVKVFGMRQLSRRNPRRAGRVRQSVGSDAAMLAQDGDQKSAQFTGNRSRSVSGSSAILLNRQGGFDHRRSMGLDSAGSTAPGDTPMSGRASAFSYLPGSSQVGGHGGQGPGGIVNLKNAETVDPYYRPPRPRRANVAGGSPQHRTRASAGSSDWGVRRWSRRSPDAESAMVADEEPSASRRGTPVPPLLGANRERANSDAEEGRASKTDYATREVDFYYGVRGPALSNQPTRRLKTGPADPTGPVSSASGWLKVLFGGKTKEKGKGFEVVRSSRAPATMGLRSQSGTVLPSAEQPYSDEPHLNQQPERNRDLALSDEGDAIGAGTRHLPSESPPSPVSSDGNARQSESEDEDWVDNRRSQISAFPPSLPTIETPGGIELPSRIGSKTSSKPTRDNTQRSTRPPLLPRRSSKRGSSFDQEQGMGRLSTVAQSPPTSPHESESQSKHGLAPSRLPFDPPKQPSHNGNQLSVGGISMNSSILAPSPDPEEFENGHERHSSSVFGAFERPSSMGYVQQHRASDNIHTADLGGQPLVESRAEIVQDPSPRTPSPDQIGHAL